MTPEQEQVKMLSDHWPLLTGLTAGVVLFSVALIRVFRLFFWNEDRIERIATKLLTSEAVKNTMTDVATQVFKLQSVHDSTTRAEMRLLIDDLRKRDDERAAAVGRVHVRIDELHATMMQFMTQLAGKNQREG